MTNAFEQRRLALGLTRRVGEPRRREQHLGRALVVEQRVEQVVDGVRRDREAELERCHHAGTRVDVGAPEAAVELAEKLVVRQVAVQPGRAAGDQRTPAPVPSAKPLSPAVPASVVTSPLARSIARMASLKVSATKSVPRPSSARPCGVSKRAAVPLPSASPTMPSRPAIVDTVPSGSATRRIAWL